MNQWLSVQLEATDPEGDDVTWSLESGPDDLDLSEDGLLTWKPGIADLGPL